jgi:hypothetical protein
MRKSDAVVIATWQGSALKHHNPYNISGMYHFSVSINIFRIIKYGNYLSEISDSYGGEYEVENLLGYSTM